MKAKKPMAWANMINTYWSWKDIIIYTDVMNWINIIKNHPSSKFISVIQLYEHYYSVSLDGSKTQIKTRYAKVHALICVLECLDNLGI